MEHYLNFNGRSVSMLNGHCVSRLLLLILVLLFSKGTSFSQNLASEPEASMTVLYASSAYRPSLKSLLHGIGGCATYMFGRSIGTRLDVGVQFPATYVTSGTFLGIHYWISNSDAKQKTATGATLNEPIPVVESSAFKLYAHGGIGLAFQTRRNDIGQLQTDDPATSGLFDTRSISAIAYRLTFGVQYKSFDVGILGAYSPISQYGYMVGLQVGYKVFEVKGN